MKKIFCLLLTLICVVGIYGCKDLNRQPAALADNIAIPENGEIEASVFEILKQENKVVTFTGSSGGIRYEWLIFGSDIEEAAPLNLGLEIMEADKNKVSFRFLSTENFGFTPMLSIYLNDVWAAQSASIYENETEVSITGIEKSILNFSPNVQTGNFIIVPNIEQVDVEENTEALQEPAQPPATVPIISDGKATEQDKYKTDPVPEGKPLPAEPQEQTVTEESYTCIFSIECSSILNNLQNLKENKLDIIPSNGIIFAEQTVTFYEGESVYDVLQRICKENGIPLESSWTPIYNSAYVEGIYNLYEFDCGNGSGWMYRIDGWYPNYGCSRYPLKQGEKVEWRYTCDYGKDIGGGYAVNE